MQTVTPSLHSGIFRAHGNNNGTTVNNIFRETCSNLTQINRISVVVEIANRKVLQLRLTRVYSICLMQYGLQITAESVK